MFLGKPDEMVSEGMIELIRDEIEGMNAAYRGDEEKMLIAGGECAQRVEDLPSAEELVARIMKEGTEIIEGIAARLLRK